MDKDALLQVLDRKEFINKCRYYYTTYALYLSDYKPYNGFADFLSKHPLDQ